MDYEGIRIDSCGDCGGTWLDAGELKHVVRAREVRFDPDERRAIASAAKITGIKMSEVDRAYTCPKCKEKTSAIHYGGDSGIIIDRCPACRGIWLDRGELEKIQQVCGRLGRLSPRRLGQARGQATPDSSRHGISPNNVNVSRFGFVNAMINGILDVLT